MAGHNLFAMPVPKVGQDPVRWMADMEKFMDRLVHDLRYLQNSGKVTSIQLEVLTAEPAQPFDGMIVYADGSNWDPGSGDGYYGYQTGAWVKL